jgi:hypothetical protein
MKCFQLTFYFSSLYPVQPRTIFTCGLKNLTQDLRIARSMFTRAAQAVATVSNKSQDTIALSSHSLVTALQDSSRPLVQSSYVLEIDSSLLGTTRYLIGQACSTVGTPSWDLAMVVGKELGSCLVPWAAVALPLPRSSTSSSSSSSKQEGFAKLEKEGRVFCFLPLPASSGMPAHINGTFELSSNRRDIWHGASDLLGVGKQRAAWNALLLADIAAPLYAHILAIAATQLGPTEAYYSLFPGSIEALRARDTVKALVTPWLKHISTTAVAYTNANGGQWIAPQDAIFLDDRAAKDEDLYSGLLQLNMPITSTSMPPNLTRMMVTEALSQPEILLPPLLRQHMRKFSNNSRSSIGISGISPVFAAALLDFAASDVLEDDRESVLELVDVKLIPLLDGSLGGLIDNHVGESLVFVPRGKNEVELFSKAGKKLVDVGILRPETLQK